jgi:ectoine hydroxylase-related dioxygenase (phytanoyl-CoA dioxygenase family)
MTMSGARYGRDMELPAITDDLDRAAHDLRGTGLCLVSGAIDEAMTDEVRRRLYAAADDDVASGARQPFGLDNPADGTNIRVWNLLNRGWCFTQLAEHPAALRLLRGLLGQVQLSNISANITGPGGGEMVLHADQLYMPQPWSGPQGANVIWLADDFTEANGATRVVPGSHVWNRTPGPDDRSVTTVPLEGPAGTMCVMDGRVWHHTGNNVTATQQRGGIFAWYTIPIYRTQENWFLSLDPIVVQNASDTLLELLCYRSAGLGLVNGRSPR